MKFKWSSNRDLVIWNCEPFGIPLSDMPSTRPLIVDLRAESGRLYALRLQVLHHRYRVSTHLHPFEAKVLV